MKVAGIYHLTLRSQDPETARRFHERVVGHEFLEVPVSRETGWGGDPGTLCSETHTWHFATPTTCNVRHS
jgi:hypothetical protein